MQENAYFQISADGKEITFNERLGQVLFVWAAYLIGSAFFLLAIYNLLFARPFPLVSLLASVAWIAIMLAFIVPGCRRNGIRQQFINVVGSCVRNRFAEFTSDDSGTPILGFGYKLGSTRHYTLKLRPEGIASVDWGPGQGNIPGRENDWHVAMWFDVGSVVFERDQSGLGIYVVGPSGPKATRETFGAGLIEFLRTNGVQLALPPRELVGQEAEVTKSVSPFGKVKIGGDEYAAFPSEGVVEEGARVTVDEIRGTTVYVSEEVRSEPQEMESGDRRQKG